MLLAAELQVEWGLSEPDLDSVEVW